MARRCNAGGSIWLRELIETYPAELAVDFRSLFNISITDVGDTVSYKEAIYLISGLSDNPRSWFFCKLNQWDYPVTLEYLAILNLLDSFIMANSDPKKKKNKPHPRPYDNKKLNNKSKNIEDDEAKIGTATRPREDVIALLNKMNPQSY